MERGLPGTSGRDLYVHGRTRCSPCNQRPDRLEIRPVGPGTAPKGPCLRPFEAGPSFTAWLHYSLGCTRARVGSRPDPSCDTGRIRVAAHCELPKGRSRPDATYADHGFRAVGVRSFEPQGKYLGRGSLPTPTAGSLQRQCDPCFGSLQCRPSARGGGRWSSTHPGNPAVHLPRLALLAALSLRIVILIIEFSRQLSFSALTSPQFSFIHPDCSPWLEGGHAIVFKEQVHDNASSQGERD